MYDPNSHEDSVKSLDESDWTPEWEVERLLRENEGLKAALEKACEELKTLRLKGSLKGTDNDSQGDYPMEESSAFRNALTENLKYEMEALAKAIEHEKKEKKEIITYNKGWKGECFIWNAHSTKYGIKIA